MDGKAETGLEREMTFLKQFGVMLAGYGYV